MPKRSESTVPVDDGDVEDDMVHVEKAALSDGKELASAKEEYLQRVRDRLTKTKELDRQEEKDRIQESIRRGGTMLLLVEPSLILQHCQ